MTAQIAIMNKNAVALATDSAVTTRNARGVKVHNSANKLFTLSKYFPVGIMVYANAEFMEYPWETLIKVYRSQLGNRSFAHLREYAESFFSFLASQTVIFTTERQERWFQSQATRILEIFNNDFANVVREHINQNGNIDDEKIQSLFAGVVDKVEARVYANGLLPMYTTAEEQETFKATASPLLDAVLVEVFQALPIEAFRERMKSVVMHQLMTDSGFDYTGVVFSGFGETELLPVVESYWTDALFAGKLRYVSHVGLSNDLNVDPIAAIIPFAQSDTVLRFLRGVDPTYKRECFSHVDSLIKEVNLKMAEVTEEEHWAKLGEFSGVQRDLLVQRLETVESERFLSPVLDVIDSLPKDDLAAIAESLVNLTSFQRKILREVESVGGPIDVAVISKGDGFIWIKRKHYFPHELNAAFFANYFGAKGNENRDE